jgi:hypothetical protein
MTSFDTFLTALSKATNLEGVLGEEFIEYPPTEDVRYGTTPLAPSSLVEWDVTAFTTRFSKSTVKSGMTPR